MGFEDFPGIQMIKDIDSQRKIDQQSPDIMTTEQAAAYLTISESSLEKDRMTGALGVPYFKLGALVRYHKEDLYVYLSTRERITPGNVKP